MNTSHIFQAFLQVGREKTVTLLDDVKRLGFKYATEAGLTISIDQMRIPKTKVKLVEKTNDEVLRVHKQYRDGLITNGERYNKVIDIWAHVTEKVSEEMIKRIKELKRQGDSCGGVIECLVRNVPSGLGMPVFDKLEADLAKALMSLPATKGFEIGSGFSGTYLKGSEHNDAFIKSDDIRKLMNWIEKLYITR